MLSETEARELLAKPAATIDFEPGCPAGMRPRPRLWPVVAAAAAVLLLVGGGTFLLRDSPTAAPVVKPHRSDETVLAANQVPSVFGYDARSARRLLAQRGLVVTTLRKESLSCGGVNRAVRTRPPVGTRVDRGSRVTLVVTGSGLTVDCRGPSPDPAWQLLDFANGRGAAPAFAGRVSLFVDGQLVREIGRVDAASPGRWGSISALTVLRDASAQIELMVSDRKTRYDVPSLLSRLGTPPLTTCGSRRAGSLGNREALSISFPIPSDGISAFCDATVQVDRDPAGRIDAVTTYPRTLTWGPRVRAPNAVGLTRLEAKKTTRT